MKLRADSSRRLFTQRRGLHRQHRGPVQRAQPLNCIMGHLRWLQGHDCGPCLSHRLRHRHGPACPLCDPLPRVPVPAYGFARNSLRIPNFHKLVGVPIMQKNTNPKNQKCKTPKNQKSNNSKLIPKMTNNTDNYQ